MIVPIIRTEHWLKHLYEDDRFLRKKDKLPPFKRLMDHHQEWKVEEWYDFLFKNGLLPPSENVKKYWLSWQKSSPYVGLAPLLKQLQNELEGPSIDVFPLPINVYNDFLMKVMQKKNGVTFSSMILLFLHESVSLKEREALLIHEYHHACRLAFQKMNERNITLLESIVMEGLAEHEVKKRLGKKYVSAWMEMYQDELLFHWWEKVVKNKRNLRGRRKHVSYIYGGEYGIPRWLGYAIGYRMVSSFLQNSAENGEKGVSSYDLLKINGEEIYKNSMFYKDE